MLAIASVYLEDIDDACRSASERPRPPATRNPDRWATSVIGSSCPPNQISRTPGMW